MPHEYHRHVCCICLPVVLPQPLDTVHYKDGLPLLRGTDYLAYAAGMKHVCGMLLPHAVLRKMLLRVDRQAC